MEIPMEKYSIIRYFKSPYKAEVIRGIGVFSPLGAIIGYVQLKD